MALVKQYHKDTDTTYVYESDSYWDSEKGQSRSRRKLIGKLDPETGEIIPTARRGRKKKGEESSAEYTALKKQYADQEGMLKAQKIRIEQLEQENRNLKNLIKEFSDLSEAYIALRDRARSV